MLDPLGVVLLVALAVPETARGRVEPPVDEHPEARVAPPRHAGVAGRGPRGDLAGLVRWCGIALLAVSKRNGEAGDGEERGNHADSVQLGPVHGTCQPVPGTAWHVPCTGNEMPQHELLAVRNAHGDTEAREASE